VSIPRTPPSVLPDSRETAVSITRTIAPSTSWGTTTLLFYAHWLPAGDKTYIDRLEAIRAKKVDKMLTQERAASTP